VFRAAGGSPVRLETDPPEGFPDGESYGGSSLTARVRGRNRCAIAKARQTEAGFFFTRSPEPWGPDDGP